MKYRIYKNGVVLFEAPATEEERYEIALVNDAEFTIGAVKAEIWMDAASFYAWDDREQDEPVFTLHMGPISELEVYQG